MEKQQDVFTLKTYNETLYYGNRNHQIRKLDIAKKEWLGCFETPHYDKVTALEIMKGTLISGSRDKVLKVWDVEKKMENLIYQAYDQGEITTLICDTQQNILLSGQRDGKIRFFRLDRDRRLDCLEEASAHLNSVTSICQINNSNPYGTNAFASSSADNSIKIWRLDY